MQRQFVVLVAGFTLAVAGCSTTNSPKTETAQPVNAPETVPTAKTEILVPEWPMTATSPVARVNGVDITAADFNKEVGRLVQIAPNLLINKLNKFRAMTTVRLIDQHLVEVELAAQKLSADSEEVDNELTDFYNTVGGPEDAKAAFDRIGVTPEELRVDMVRAVKLKKLLRASYVVSVTTDEARA